MLDLARIKARASDRQAEQPNREEAPQLAANLANRLTVRIGTVKAEISQLARLASNDDPDRWCWPASEAMNTAEVARFHVRVVRFTRRGIGQAQAEKLADLLVIRDRQADGRRVCLECGRLSGAASSAWRCANHHAAGVSRDLPADLVVIPQRCPGFKEAPQ